MVMNGFDTNFDLANEVYAVNTVGFHYVNEPIEVQRRRWCGSTSSTCSSTTRSTLSTSTATSSNYFPTGTSLQPTEFTDTVIQGQAQRGILELEFPYDGDYMFHAHVSEFAELGWSGFFRVGDPAQLSRGRGGRALLRPALGRGEHGLMEAGREPSAASAAACRPGRWALIPLALIAVAIGAFALLGGPGLGERTGPPVEEVAVEQHGAAAGRDRADPAQRRPRPGRGRPGRRQRRLRALRRRRRPRDRPARLDHAARSPTPGSKARPTRSSSSPRPAARSKPRSRSPPKRRRPTSTSTA